MAKIFILVQLVEDNVQVEFAVINDTYDVGVWVNRWFSVNPMAIELNENCHHVVIAHPAFLVTSDIALIIETDLLEYVQSLSHKDQKMTMVDDDVLDRLI